MHTYITHRCMHTHTWGGQFLQKRERKRERSGCYHYGPEKVVSTFLSSQSCLRSNSISNIPKITRNQHVSIQNISFLFQLSIPFQHPIPTSLIMSFINGCVIPKHSPYVFSCCPASSHVLLGEFHRSLSYVGIYFQVAEGVITVSLSSLPHSCCPLLAKLHYLNTR